MLTDERSAGGLGLLVLVFLSIAVVGSGAVAGERQLTILVTSGSSGRLLDEEADASVAVLAATVRALEAQERAAGREVVTIDAGRTLLPYAESRFDGGRTIVGALAAMDCRAFAPAPLDFAIGGVAMTELAHEAPFPVLNPLADKDGDLPSSIAVIGLADGLELLLANLMDPAFTGDMNAAGYRNPAPLAPEVLDGVRETALRVAVVHSKGRGDSMTTRELSWRMVEDPHGLDLLIDPDFGQDVVLRRESEGGPVWLVGRRETKSTPWTVAVIELKLAARDGRWRVAEARQRIVTADLSLAVDPELDGAVRQAFGRFRESQSVRFAAVAPGDRDGLASFVLEAMREAAGAEVAVLNRGGLRPVATEHFSGERLTREAVMRLLSLDQTLVVGEVKGSTLIDLVTTSASRVKADGSPAKDSLQWCGVSYEMEEGKPTSITVNGRPVYPDDPYRVVSSEYLASGGDNYPELEALEGLRLRDGAGAVMELREAVVIPRLESAETPFADLERRPLWRYSVDRLRFSLDAVSTSHDASYDDASDSRARAKDSGSLLVDAWLWADRELPSWKWENDLRARFGLIDTEGADASELDDDLQLESAALFTRWELPGGAHPFANLKLDSEFRRNLDGDGERQPRQLEETVGAGVGWSFTHWPRLRLAAVGRHYSNIDRSAEVGVTAEALYQLKESGRRPGFDARLMVEYLSGSDADVQRADLDLRLRWVLRERLLFTPGLNYYVYDDSSRQGRARYGRLTLGLSYTWRDKHQAR